MRRLLVLALVLAGCSPPTGPREVRGPGAAAVVAAPPPGRIVVAEHAHRGGRLVLIDERGRRVRELTEPPSQPSVDVTPAFSPDGRFVAFASSRQRARGGDMSIWVVGVDGGDVVRLTDGASTDITPAFAPDGRSLTFASTRGGTLDLWQVEIEATGAALRAGRLSRLTDGPGAELYPAWSHDGELLAYTVVDRPGARAVVLRDRDGGSARRLVDGEMPAFTPDGRQVVYSAVAGGRDDADLWIIPTAGGAARRLVDEPHADETMPRFSRDGRFVFATSLVRDDDRRPLLTTLVFAELDDPAAGLRALQEPIPSLRNGADVAPVALDAGTLRQNPRYHDAVRRTLVR